ncbi:ROK family transcriptional regulator [Capillibacterium thermochitinicola]|uniref:ROK family transcriptional regulator n=1 Tax=Capillibacterium thermochitinicola TaxID=2699427 RepID=A0A8J6I0Y7_9FIRM|nr:ROK family transcriptional regulator [Capillibacterium thermochitinicola]MBA2133258.1 ROK family transcriptional regulator [Capillibacterium thermochitinicola]
MERERRGLSSTSLIRSYNVVSVLQTLYREGACSRARLAKVTKMSPATITRIVSELLSQGIITEHGIGKSNGGRKPILLKLSYEKLFIIGIQIRRDQVALGLADLKGKLMRKTSYSPYSLEPDTLIRELVQELQNLMQNANVKKEHILGVGVAISGIVESERGILLQSVNLGWRDVPVAEMLEKYLDFPVVVENDANAAALAELWFGNPKNVANFLLLKTSTGVGAGIIYNRKLLTGPRGMAGEIGHIPLKKDGQPCRCGQQGCLETYLYFPDVLKRYQSETGKELKDWLELYTKVLNRDPVACQILEDLIEILSIAISLCGGLLDLDMVIISGIWANFKELLIERLERKFQTTLELSGLKKKISVHCSTLGEDSDLLGAVGLFTQKWFTPPI